VEQASLLASAAPRAEASVSSSDLAALVSGNTAFALDLLGALTGRQAPASNENLVISPHSISLALAMTYAGARRLTAEEMVDVLHFDLPPDLLHPAFNSLAQAIAARSRDFPAQHEEEEDAQVALNVVNQLWAQRSYAFLPQFLDLLASEYGAGLRLVDFIKDHEAARRAVNEWVAEVTKNRIKNILSAGSVDDMTRLVLTNAVYLKAPWDTPFEKQLTADGDFHLSTGSTVTVPFMHQSELLGYAEGEGWQAVELPYKGRELSMVVFLPETTELGAFISTFDADRLEQMLSALTPETVSLSLPTFETRSELSLSDTLNAMGMRLAFSGDADFGGMTAEPGLLIDSIVHNGFISVDEKGTEAAAATAVVMRATSAPMEVKEFTADRPFVWMIRDVETGALLFLGQMVDPSAEE